MVDGSRNNKRPGRLGTLISVICLLVLGLGVGIVCGLIVKEPNKVVHATSIAHDGGDSSSRSEGGVAQLTDDVESGIEQTGEYWEETGDINELSTHYYSEIAVLPPSPPKPPQSRCDTWRLYAVSIPPDDANRPKIAIIIDDMGVDKVRTARATALPGPLTMSFLPYARDLPAQTEAARNAGHELLVHMPMQPLSASIDPGPNALTVDLSDMEIQKRLNVNLSRFSNFVGINNHMGSKFTANTSAMSLVMLELRRRGLLFIDSMTSPQSVGVAVAHRMGVPALPRDVFLDHSSDPALIGAQLVRLEALAISKGSAIAIGHPRDATIAALSKWLPKLSSRGIALVPVSAVVDMKNAQAAIYCQ